MSTYYVLKSEQETIGLDLGPSHLFFVQNPSLMEIDVVVDGYNSLVEADHEKQVATMSASAWRLSNS